MMVNFKGFETKEKAQRFIKKNGGFLTYDKRSAKTNKPTGVGVDYGYAVRFGGLNAEKYPYCVQWNDVK